MSFQDFYKLHAFSVVWEESDSVENTTDGKSVTFILSQHEASALNGKVSNTD